MSENNALARQFTLPSLMRFALPNIIGHRIDPFIAAVTACSLNSGAYIAEIFRGGIQSISQGQFRAGLSLGMTYGQTMRYIVLPQAFKRIIPPLGNEFIAMLKDSSLVSVIGFEELTRTSRAPGSSSLLRPTARLKFGPALPSSTSRSRSRFRASSLRLKSVSASPTIGDPPLISFWISSE
mgnify:CR=1 FL=1